MTIPNRLKARVAVIMPTINVPPNLKAWAAQLTPDDVIIIAGNGISPHDGIRELLDELDVPTIYMHPDDPISNQWETSAYLDLNHHHRRSLALLQAMTYHPDVIITLDDDNFPISDFWVDTVFNMLTVPNKNMMKITSPTGWHDAGKLCEPRVMHRGYPHWLRNDETISEITSPRGERVGVFAGLWVGDPDCDATERIILGTQIQRVKNPYVFDLGTWSPFNSQSTAFVGELAPLMLMWPGVGRFDDIFASYLTRAYMDANEWHHAAGQPAVRHDRNPHDFVKDLENELFGYKNSRAIIKVLRDSSEETREMPPAIGFELLSLQLMARVDGLPNQAMRAFKAWTRDVKGLK